ncbi:hypothetical protein U9M48_016527 [Paspalum notatum var. saurae]|uniref:Uncharacterized protein n=1 Tax=Paspalum notatum var. saurae TaxID=547442 RepID=A0AAQ3WMN6_PASNO
MLGFFLEQTRFAYYARMKKARMKQHASALAPTFLPVPGSPLGPMARALTSFIADDDGTFNYAEPLAARRGFVLMKLVPRTSELMNNAAIRLLGICNPVTGEQHLLPPLNIFVHALRSYAIITVADLSTSSSSSGRFSFSQLLVTAQCADSELELDAYSAATRSWSAPTNCLNSYGFSVVDDDDDRMYKLSVEVGTTRASLTKLVGVRSGGKPVLSVTADGNNLVVAAVYFAHVTIWTQQQGSGSGAPAAAVWPRTTFRIPPAEVRPYEWFDFSRGSMLGVYRDGAVFILDLEKKVMEKVMDSFLPIFDKVVDPAVVAYEMDLVEFFTHQLGGLCRGCQPATAKGQALLLDTQVCALAAAAGQGSAAAGAGHCRRADASGARGTPTGVWCANEACWDEISVGTFLLSALELQHKRRIIRRTRKQIAVVSPEMEQPEVDSVA